MQNITTHNFRKLLFSFLLFSAVAANAQNNQWVWQAGSETPDEPGVYGNKLQPSYNNSPGARQGAATWTDKAGNLWMFGGYGGYSTYVDNGINYYFSDMWEFNPITTEWVWVAGSNSFNVPGVYGVQGTPSLQNLPGSRQGAVTWTDAAGNFWMFGGQGYDSTTNTSSYNATAAYLNDVWEYSPVTNMWTWVSGSPAHNLNGNYERQNKSSGGLPGGRAFAAGAVDPTGNVWIFGGTGYDALSTNSGNLNDLWEYVTASNAWIWQSGSNVNNQYANYGTEGTGSVNNVPGAKYSANGFCDTAGNFYIFGGNGNAGEVGDNYGYLNDLWRYTPSTKVWAWINGSNQGQRYSIYGNTGVFNTPNSPGGRAGAITWLDSTKNFWVFGGYGYDSLASGELSDLWEYSLTTNQWAFMGGNGDKANLTGQYGIENSASPNNLPGSRSFGQAWVDAFHDLWLFGGTGYAQTATSYQAYLTDVWELIAPSSALPITVINLAAVEKGTADLVTWQTVSEVNSAYFNVQRSGGNASNFATIGKVNAAGNSSATLDYAFTDAQPLQGDNLYRLQMVDEDGNFKYSKTVIVNRSAPVNLKLYPNPVVDAVNIYGLDEYNTSSISLVDNAGNKLSQTSTIGGTYTLNVKQLAAGTYYVQVTSNKTTTTIKFVKQ